MITKTVFLASLDTGAFLLGYAGENEHIRYDIRCDSIFSDYPDATVSMLIKSPDGTVYPKVLTIDKPSVYWVVTASDTANDGNGQVQITFTKGDEVIKTVVASTVTMPSLFVTGEEPDPIATWIDDANEVLGQVQSAIEEIPEEIQTEVAAQMSSTVDDWLEENIINPSSPPLDRSLTLSNAAAPADLVGTKADAIYDTVTNQAIATVSDGANGMVVKELDVSVSPVQDLHGQANPYPAGGGANLFGVSQIVNRTNLTVTINSDLSSITINGTASESTNIGIYIINGSTLPYGDYYYHCDDATNRRLLMIKRSGGQSRWINSGSVVTIGETDYPEYVYYAFDSGTVFNNKVIKFQFNSPSSVTTYSPYVNICPITGWTGANVYRTGKNILNTNDAEIGTAWNGSPNTARARLVIELLPGVTTYKLSMNGAITVSNLYWNVSDTVPATDAGGDITSSIQSSAMTINTTKKYLILAFSKTAISKADIDAMKLQLETGSTATTYEPYAGQTYAIAFPGAAGTVYGGTLNATTGVLTVDHASVLLGSKTWTTGTDARGQYFKTTIAGIKWSLSTLAMPDAICEKYAPATSGNVANGTFAVSNSSDTVYVRDLAISTAANFETDNANIRLVYGLATPVTYTLTAAQVTTLLGTNNVWADCGDIAKLEYPADTKLYIDKVIAAAVAAL